MISLEDDRAKVARNTGKSDIPRRSLPISRISLSSRIESDSRLKRAKSHSPADLFASERYGAPEIVCARTASIYRLLTAIYVGFKRDELRFDGLLAAKINGKPRRGMMTGRVKSERVSTTFSANWKGSGRFRRFSGRE